MKKLTLTAITLLTFTFSNSQSKIIKTNPMGLAMGFANVGYEIAFEEEEVSLTFSGLFYNKSDVSGYGVGIDYNYYFGETILEGWHAGPGAGFLFLTGDFDSTSAVFIVGGSGGHQWVMNKHLAIDLFANIGYVTGGNNEINFNPSAVALGLSIGYAW